MTVSGVVSSRKKIHSSRSDICDDLRTASPAPAEIPYEHSGEKRAHREPLQCVSKMFLGTHFLKNPVAEKAVGVLWVHQQHERLGIVANRGGKVVEGRIYSALRPRAARHNGIAPPVAGLGQ